MANKKETGTIYQQLNNFFNLSGFGMAPIQKQSDGTKIIIRGNSPDEIKRKALEIEQQRKLQDKFFKTTDRSFQKAMQFEASRLQLYTDLEGMEYYPLIASALDLFMEEATTIGDDGKMLKIYSNKERIKYLLEEFFYEVVNVNTNLPFWTRNLAKYGDNFIILYGERKKGITHVKQMVNYEVERFERIQNGKPVVKFRERMTGDEFNIFEIAHFRLLGDDKLIPYGSSVLNKVRRVFRQLCMAEDAMLTYRIIRAGEKKVFKIDVGNVDEDDIEDYIYKVATKFKKTPQINHNDGQIDYRFNILGNDEDYFLPVRNANTQTGIDTLPGASNLDAIQDISYLRDNLFTGLGIPKPFLSMQDASGGGKNMAQFDIRFAKKVNRIQQAMIQELNKMAMVHLYLMGYDKEDISNFTLALTNPSTQSELVKAELLREKAQTYTELTRGENGIAAMSHTKAKRILFNMSDKEIVDDLKQQKMEKVVQQELADAPVIIKKSGIYHDIDKKYGEEGAENMIPQNSGGQGDDQGGGMGGPLEGGQEPIAGLPNQSPADLPPVQAENIKLKYNLLEDRFLDNVNKLVYGDEYKIKEEKQKQLIKENENIVDQQNQLAENTISEIDKILIEGNSINTKFDSVDDDENVEDFNNFDLNIDEIETIDDK